MALASEKMATGAYEAADVYSLDPATLTGLGKTIAIFARDDRDRCPTCYGRGYKPEGRRSGRGIYLRTCRRCGGAGEVPGATRVTTP